MNLDAAMTGTFTSAGKDRDYEITVSIALSESRMTKIVTFLPKRTISNSCPFPVTVFEKDVGLLVPARTCVPFWPAAKAGGEVVVSFEVEGTTQRTPAVYADRTNIAVLKLDNQVPLTPVSSMLDTSHLFVCSQYGGLCANVHVMETKATVLISQFMPGETPLLLINDTIDLTVQFQQKNTAIANLSLPPGQNVAYAWDNLTATPQEIIWTPVGSKTITGFPATFTAVRRLTQFVRNSFNSKECVN
jgi:hypothetical protein